MPSASEPFRVICAEDAGTIHPALSTIAGLPHLPALIAQLLQLQTDPTDAVVRKYQSSIVARGFFTIPSPRTERPIASGDSLILPDRTIFYRFPEEPDLLLAANNLGKGYPLTGILLLGRRLLIQIGEPTWGVRADHAQAVADLLHAPAWWPPRPARDIRLFTGDPNFAHHVWNQLPALEALLRVRPALPLQTVFATFQPLGPLPAIFPELGPIDCAWEHANIPPHHNAPGRVCINPGGVRLTRSVRDRLTRLAAQRSSPETRALAAELGRHHPVLWISLRTRNRTMRNQTEVLSLLCRRAFERFPRCAIILDGHSHPDDLATNPCYDTAEAEAVAAADAAEAATIVASVRPWHGEPAQRLVQTVGLPILDALLLAGQAEFYVCHHGTVQHKIGWLTETPGVVHSNGRTLRLSPAEWVYRQAEGSVRPCYVPEAFVEDEVAATAEDAETRSRLFESYRITDPKRFVAFVLDALQRSAAGAGDDGLRTPRKDRGRDGWKAMVRRLLGWRAS